MKNKILIVTAMFYDEIGGDLFHYARKTIEDPNTTKDGWVGAEIFPIDVPGVFEIPVMISKHIHKMDGAIALGCVIKGQTSHFHYLCASVINSLTELSIKTKKPIGNGILTCNNIYQALKRANPNKEDKGGDAAEAAISVLKIIKDA